MADFSFAPNPAGGWGSQLNMGQALFDALTRGFGMMGLYDKTRQITQTTPAQIAAQQAAYGASQSSSNYDSFMDQYGLGTRLRGLHMDPSSVGYSPHSITGTGASNPFEVPAPVSAAPATAPVQPAQSPYAYPSPTGPNAPAYDGILDSYLHSFAGG